MPATSLVLLATSSAAPAPETLDGLPSHWMAGLGQLERACERCAELDRLQRERVTEACQQIAMHIGKAGLHSLELPRDYEVREIDRSWVLVKYAPNSREVTFVASGEESLWTRLRLQTSRLTEEQVRELVADLEGGLIQELVEWVEARGTSYTKSASPQHSEPQRITVAHPVEMESSTLVDRRPLRMTDLGRPRRRDARSVRRTA